MQFCRSSRLVAAVVVVSILHASTACNEGDCTNRALYTCSLTTCEPPVSLMLSDKNLFGTVPYIPSTSYVNGPVEMYSNQLSGTIPSWMCSWTNLVSKFEWSNNLLTGTIPPGVAQLTRVTDLELASNRLTGSVPAGIDNMKSELQTFTINTNNISGTLPASIGSLTRMSDLNCGNNQLHGTLPPSLGSLASLTVLDLSNNIFSGTIPKSICSIVTNKLKTCSLSGSGKYLCPLPTSCASSLGTCGASCSDAPSSHTTVAPIVPTTHRTTVKTTVAPPTKAPGDLTTASEATTGSGSATTVAPSSTSSMKPATTARSNSTTGGATSGLLSVGDWVGIGAAVAAILAGAAVGIAFFVRRKQNKLQNPELSKALSLAYTSGLSQSTSDLLSSFLPIDVTLERLLLPPESINFGPQSECIAHGGGGRIFRCEALKTTHGFENGQTVALKEIYSMLDLASPNRDKMQEFGKEMAALMQLRHEHVVQFHGVFIEQDKSDSTQYNRFFLVMEFASNGSLADHITRHYDCEGSPSVEQRHLWLTQVARAVLYLHSQRFVHRDLKPQNVLLDEEWRCRLTDFGIARAMGESGFTAQQTPLTMEMGTLQFMPPEVLRNNSAARQPPSFSLATAWDTYSFSLLCIAVFKCSVVPFPNSEDRIVMAQMAATHLRPELPSDILGPQYCALIEDMWNEDPQLRPKFSTIVERLEQLAPKVPDSSD